MTYFCLSGDPLFLTRFAPALTRSIVGRDAQDAFIKERLSASGGARKILKPKLCFLHYPFNLTVLSPFLSQERLG